VAFEGIDGAGKTTQARLLAERLRNAGLSVVETKEPTRGPHGQRLRESAAAGRLRKAAGRLRKDEELQAFLEDRKHHVETLIAPALAQCRVVLVDRYYFSTAAYQGARGFDPEAIITVNESFAPKPDLLVLLDIPVEEALRRIGVRENGSGTNHFEKRTTLQKCAAIFRRLERPELLRLDGREPAEAIHEKVVSALDAGPLFRAACHKEYLHECEPEYLQLPNPTTVRLSAARLASPATGRLPGRRECAC